MILVISTVDNIYYYVTYWLYDCMLILMTAMACFVHHIYLVISSLSV